MLTLVNNKWIANNSVIWPIKFGINSQSNSNVKKVVEIPTSLSKEQITDQFGDPSKISAWSLPEFINKLEQAGFSAKRYSFGFKVNFQNLYFFLAMMFISAAFCMRQNRLGNSSLNVLAAVLLAFYCFTKKLCLILGINGQLPVFVAAWGPSFAAFLISVGLFLNREEG